MEPIQPAVPTQPTVAPPAPAHHATVSSNVPYESNPFRVSISGLITILKTNPMSAILLSIVLILLYLLIFVCVGIIARIVPIVGILLGIVAMVSLFPISVGSFAALGVSSMKGETNKSMDLIKQGASKMLGILGAGILVYLAVVLGLILFIIPGLIFAAWFSFTFIAMFDEDLGAIAAMKRSKELAKGHFFEIMGALFAGLLLSGATSNGGGLLAQAIVLGPMIGRYEQLKALKASGAPKPKVHWLNYLLVLFVPVLTALLVILIAVSYNTTSKATTDLNGSKGSNSIYDSSYPSTYNSSSFDN